MGQDSEAPEYWKVGDDYEAFAEREGIPRHTGYYVQNIYECEVDDWDRTGQKGALVNLVGHEGLCDVQIHEIAPGESTDSLQHLHEQICYVVEGQGATAVGEEGEEVTFEWDKNALFAIPRNARYKHINVSDDEPVRIVTETDLPTLFELFGDEEFIFDNTYEFTNASDSEYYSTEGTMFEGSKFPAIWQSNFIPDIHTYDEIQHWRERGAGGASMQFNHPDTSLWSHISQMPVGTYKKAHRHHPGANVIILEGEGYSFMWSQEDEEEGVDVDDKLLIEWGPGTLFPPPALWYHQHFNTGAEPARYLALHPSSLVFSGKDSIFDPVRTYNNIQYPDEDPDVRAYFQEQLQENGIESEMPEQAYEDADYDFEQNYESMAEEEDLKKADF
jgi:gentisate 1,2-dioxygenase